VHDVGFVSVEGVVQSLVHGGVLVVPGVQLEVQVVPPLLPPLLLEACKAGL
jgi:hypothetical protein